jgi:hypothetical protein
MWAAEAVSSGEIINELELLDLALANGDLPAAKDQVACLAQVPIAWCGEVLRLDPAIVKAVQEGEIKHARARLLELAEQLREDSGPHRIPRAWHE